MTRSPSPPSPGRVTEPAPAVSRGAASAWAEVWDCLALAAALANLARQSVEGAPRGRQEAEFRRRWRAMSRHENLTVVVELNADEQARLRALVERKKLPKAELFRQALPLLEAQ